MLHNVIAWYKTYSYVVCAILQNKAREDGYAITVLTVHSM